MRWWKRPLREVKWNVRRNAIIRKRKSIAAKRHKTYMREVARQKLNRKEAGD